MIFTMASCPSRRLLHLPSVSSSEKGQDSLLQLGRAASRGQSPICPTETTRAEWNSEVQLQDPINVHVQSPFLHRRGCAKTGRTSREWDPYIDLVRHYFLQGRRSTILHAPNHFQGSMRCTKTGKTPREWDPYIDLVRAGHEHEQTVRRVAGRHQAASTFRGMVACPRPGRPVQTQIVEPEEKR